MSFVRVLATGLGLFVPTCAAAFLAAARDPLPVGLVTPSAFDGVGAAAASTSPAAPAPAFGVPTASSSGASKADHDWGQQQRKANAATGEGKDSNAKAKAKAEEKKPAKATAKGDKKKPVKAKAKAKTEAFPCGNVMVPALPEMLMGGMGMVPPMGFGMAYPGMGVGGMGMVPPMGFGMAYPGMGVGGMGMVPPMGGPGGMPPYPTEMVGMMPSRDHMGETGFVMPPESDQFELVFVRGIANQELVQGPAEQQLEATSVDAVADAPEEAVAGLPEGAVAGGLTAGAQQRAGEAAPAETSGQHPMITERAVLPSAPLAKGKALPGSKKGDTKSSFINALHLEPSNRLKASVQVLRLAQLAKGKALPGSKKGDKKSSFINALNLEPSNRLKASVQHSMVRRPTEEGQRRRLSWLYDFMVRLFFYPRTQNYNRVVTDSSVIP